MLGGGASEGAPKAHLTIERPRAALRRATLPSVAAEANYASASFDLDSCSVRRRDIP